MRADEIVMQRTAKKRSDFSFISEIVQRGKKRPAKYRHSLSMPVYLYEDLRNHGIIDMLDLQAYQDAYFEIHNDEVTISFYNLYTREDLRTRCYHYLLVKFAGVDPLKITAMSKL